MMTGGRTGKGVPERMKSHGPTGLPIQGHHPESAPAPIQLTALHPSQKSATLCLICGKPAVIGSEGLVVMPFHTKRKGLIDITVHGACVIPMITSLAGPGAERCRRCCHIFYGHLGKRKKRGAPPERCPNDNCKARYWWRPAWTREEMKAKAPEWGRKGARESKKRRKERR